MNPDDARAHNAFGLALAGAGRLQEAIAQFQSALVIILPTRKRTTTWDSHSRPRAARRKPWNTTGKRWRRIPLMPRRIATWAFHSCSRDKPPKPSVTLKPRSKTNPITRKRRTISRSPSRPKDISTPRFRTTKKPWRAIRNTSRRRITSASPWRGKATLPRPPFTSGKRSNWIPRGPARKAIWDMRFSPADNSPTPSCISKRRCSPARNQPNCS